MQFASCENCYVENTTQSKKAARAISLLPSRDKVFTAKK